MTRGEIAEARLADGSFRGASLDAPVIGSSTPLGETLPDATDDFVAIDSLLSLRPAIAQLSSREQTILRLRFVECLTQEQIGASIGVSQMQVSRLITGIITTLRGCLLAEDHAA